MRPTSTGHLAAPRRHPRLCSPQPRHRVSGGGTWVDCTGAMNSLLPSAVALSDAQPTTDPAAPSSLRRDVSVRPPSFAAKGSAPVAFLDDGTKVNVFCSAFPSLSTRCTFAPPADHLKHPPLQAPCRHRLTNIKPKQPAPETRSSALPPPLGVSVLSNIGIGGAAACTSASNKQAVVPVERHLHVGQHVRRNPHRRSRGRRRCHGQLRR